MERLMSEKIIKTTIFIIVIFINDIQSSMKPLKIKYNLLIF
jgi:hypothetical protein